MWLRSVFLLPSLADVPPYQPVQTNQQDHTPAGETHDFLPHCLYFKQAEEKEKHVGQCVSVCAGDDDEEVELHGKLEEDRFLFSLENNSAACDVLDLREVLSLFVKEG